MMRKTLALRIGYFKAIPTYERNLLDALMKPARFDVFSTLWIRYETLPQTLLDPVDLLHTFSS
jgi:hypothetical protein